VKNSRAGFERLIGHAEEWKCKPTHNRLSIFGDPKKAAQRQVRQLFDLGETLLFVAD